MAKVTFAQHISSQIWAMVLTRMLMQQTRWWMYWFCPKTL